MDRFPSSALRAEVKAKLREARDRLSEAEYTGRGTYYFRQSWYPGAIERFKVLLKQRPRLHPSRRGVLLSGRILDAIHRPAEALPYYERLLEEFETSEYLRKPRSGLRS